MTAAASPPRIRSSGRIPAPLLGLSGMLAEKFRARVVIANIEPPL
jgi:hypothetical protein